MSGAMAGTATLGMIQLKMHEQVKDEGDFTAVG
jgi:hypothetical protein